MIQYLQPLHLACTEDELRPNMQLIQINNGVATASNGHILVKIDLYKTSALQPEQIKQLDGKFIHKEVWKEIWKCDQVEFNDANIYCHKDGIKKTFDFSASQGEFYNHIHVVNDIKDAGEEYKILMSYNPKFITRIQKIFECECLHFSFSKGNAGTIVFPAHDCGMFAVLMPIGNDEMPPRYLFN